MATLKEVLLENRPDEICFSCYGGVRGCPSNYDCLENYVLPYKNFCGRPDLDNCTKCWNTEAVLKEEHKAEEQQTTQEEPQETNCELESVNVPPIYIENLYLTINVNCDVNKP